MLRIVFFSAELVMQVTTSFATQAIPSQWHRLSVSGVWGFLKEIDLKYLTMLLSCKREISKSL